MWVLSSETFAALPCGLNRACNSRQWALRAGLSVLCVSLCTEITHAAFPSLPGARWQSEHRRQHSESSVTYRTFLYFPPLPSSALVPQGTCLRGGCAGVSISLPPTPLRSGGGCHLCSRPPPALCGAPLSSLGDLPSLPPARRLHKLSIVSPCHHPCLHSALLTACSPCPCLPKPHSFLKPTLQSDFGPLHSTEAAVLFTLVTNYPRTVPSSLQQCNFGTAVTTRTTNNGTEEPGSVLHFLGESFRVLTEFSQHLE